MDSTFVRLDIIEKATMKAGKSFGREWDKVFYALMMEAKRQHGCDLWHCGEEAFYRQKLQRGE